MGEVTMDEANRDYASYLLRIWRVRELCSTWRVSLENAQTHELRGFASLREVFEFLSDDVEFRRDMVTGMTAADLTPKEE
jgi:hypothetical protein